MLLVTSYYIPPWGVILQNDHPPLPTLCHLANISLNSILDDGEMLLKYHVFEIPNVHSTLYTLTLPYLPNTPFRFSERVWERD